MLQTAQIVSGFRRFKPFAAFARLPFSVMEKPPRTLEKALAFAFMAA